MTRHKVRDMIGILVDRPEIFSIFVQNYSCFMVKIFKDEYKDVWMIAFILILLIPAMFINLGMMPMILDEATRANVALEMIFSGDYIHPTINGELYFNKPPLFNWILVLFGSLGGFSEFSLRFPVVLSLLLFALTIYKTQKEIFGKVPAFLTALAVITCGRILFYDSLKGLIDISFSWIIYLMFWSLYYFGKKQKYLTLFLLTYLFGSVGFMLKGMPSLVFLAISLLAYFLVKSRFRELFSIRHIAGIGILVVVTGSYLMAFSRGVSLEDYFATLWSESSKRTFLDNSLWQSVRHLFFFPLDFVFHFLPWTLLLILLVFRKNRQMIRQHEGAWIFSLLFAANILVYWVSPAIYPRYLFMFLPLVFGVLFYILKSEGPSDPGYKILRILFIILPTAMVMMILLTPFLADLQLYDHFWLKYLLIVFLSCTAFILMKRDTSNFPLLVVAVLLIARIAFNFWVLPDRVYNETDKIQKNGAILAGQLFRDRELKIAEGTTIQHVTSYYIMRERGETLEFTDNLEDRSCLYIIEKEKREVFPPNEILFEFETRIRATRLCVVRFLP